jgi:UDP-N-acetyl-D-galactosamine dehydrogenase
MQTCAVIGLGYVGLGLAVALSKHNIVLGYDIDNDRLQELRDHYDRNEEVSATQLAQSKMVLTNNITEIKKATLYIVTVPTPAYFYEFPNLEPLIHASQDLASILKKGDIIVFESTVYPGTTDEICIPLLEKFSHLIHGKDFNVGYSPERMNPGDKKNTLATITKIIAAPDPKTLDIVRETYAQICKEVYAVSSIKAAEAVKILENTQRDVNIAFMNEFAKIMHALNLNVHEIIEGAKTKWSFVPFKPGLVGGHCISIDPHYLAFKAKRHGVAPDLILTARKINDGMTQFIIQEMIKLLVKNNIDTKDATIGILGVSYKEETHDLRNSLAFKLINELRDYGFKCCVHDPLNHKAFNQDKYHIHLDKFEDIDNLTVALVVVGHDFYRDLGLNGILKKCNKHQIVMDIPNLYCDEIQTCKDLIYWNL